MKPLTDSIDKIIYNVYKSKNPILAELATSWGQVVGAEFNSRSSPVKIVSSFNKGQRINILYISVENSSVSLELAYQQELIIERVAIYLGYKAIHKIKIIIRS